MSFSATEREAITHNFRRGFSFYSCVREYYDMAISVRTVNRRLTEYGLRKRDQAASDHVFRQIIQTEMQGPSFLLGYRGMWNKLRTTYNLTLPRDTVMRILRELDPHAF